MAKNKYGGGATTNVNGLKFEQETDLKSLLINIEGYSIEKSKIYYKNECIGKIAPKNKLYKIILEPNGVNWKNRISKQLLPDEAILVKKSKTVYIIEKKFQNASGSVDEKLQTCHFKLKQYKKLLAGTGYKVEYIYILNDWFKQSQYNDVLEYIIEVNCHYFFNEIPLEFLNLPY